VDQNYQKLSKSTKSLESKMAIFGGNFQFLKNKKFFGKIDGNTSQIRGNLEL